MLIIIIPIDTILQILRIITSGTIVFGATRSARLFCDVARLGVVGNGARQVQG